MNFFRKFGIYQGFSFKVEIILLSGNPHDLIMILQGMKIKTSDTLLLLMDLFIWINLSLLKSAKTFDV